jgi:hypothetical protein
MTWTGFGGQSAIGNWAMEKDATLRLRPDREGLLVRAISGTVLVTQQGDYADHVLEPGSELRVAGRGLVVAWAFTPAELAIRSAALAPARSDPADPATRAGAACAA